LLKGAAQNAVNPPSRGRSERAPVLAASHSQHPVVGVDAISSKPVDSNLAEVRDEIAVEVAAGLAHRLR